ncbi:MAG: metallophosphoesterase [Trueperaceae bacterium]
MSTEGRSLRLAIVADIHHGPDAPPKLGSRALGLLNEVIDEINERAPDLVVDLGDRINDVGKEDDERLLAEVADAFSRLRVPVRHLLGNHDVARLSIDTTESLLGATLDHQSLELNDWHLVFWQVNSAFRGGDGLQIDESDFLWLQEELAVTDRPTVVFTHAPLDNGPMVGNYYFEPMPPQFSGYANAERARRLMERSTTSVAVAGHVHWNSARTIHGIHYLTVQSLSECFTTYPEPARAWAELTLGERVSLDVHGTDEMRVQLTPRRGSSQWLTRNTRPSEWVTVGTSRRRGNG